MMMSPSTRLITACVMVLVAVAASCSIVSVFADHGLKNGFYKKSCPDAEIIVNRIVSKHAAGTPELGARLIRMFFHDCFVRGCDGSILLDSTKGGNTAEKDAIPNKTVKGFEVIDEAKAAVEKACPGIVSCADILALSARDAISFQFKRPLWEVETGRRDGTISRATEAGDDIPRPSSDFPTLLANFESKGLGLQDLVVLSGAHTIGVAHCDSFGDRLYNFTGKNNGGDTDPRLNPSYAAFLKTKCKDLNDNTTAVPMDSADSSASFDGHYYVNLKMHRGLFDSDAALLSNQRSADIVGKLAEDDRNFLDAFKNSIKRMGAVQVITGVDGQVRKNCRAVNS